MATKEVIHSLIGEGEPVGRRRRAVMVRENEKYKMRANGEEEERGKGGERWGREEWRQLKRRGKKRGGVTLDAK